MEVSKSDKESDKQDKSEKSDKSLFVRRLFAYLIDYLIISFIAAFIACAFIDGEKMIESNERLQKITNEISTSAELDTLKYEELIDAYYDTSRAQGIVALCELVIIIAYYIVYQIYNDGQTIGKKMMKLKVVSRKDELTMNQMIFRTCLSTPMVINLFSLFIISFVSKYTYFYGVCFVDTIYWIIIIESVFMALFNKNGLALHDKLFNTEVVKIN